MAGPDQNPTPQDPPPAPAAPQTPDPSNSPKPERQPGTGTGTSTPLPMPSPSQPGSPPPTEPPAPTDNVFSDAPPRHRFLAPTEWARVAHGLGALRRSTNPDPDPGRGPGADEEQAQPPQHRVARPTCWYWPPRGLPEGLYRDVVAQRAKYGAAFAVLGAAHWALMVVQVMVGAVLTALGSLPAREAVPTTALAAANTVGAGLLGLMHNSGLPDRYRMDKAQFVAVEDYIRGVLDTGIVEAEQSAEDVLNECFARFANARSTVLSNKPDVYSTPIPSAGKLDVVPCPEPSVHVRGWGQVAHRGRGMPYYL